MSNVKLNTGTLESLRSQCPDVFNKTYFTHCALLQSLDAEKFIAVETDDYNALFRKNGEHLICCNRLETFSAETIEKISNAILKEFPEIIIVFEDVVFEDNQKFSLPRIQLSFQENWWRTISPDEQYLSKRRKKVLRQRLRKLSSTLASEEVEYSFKRAVEDDIDHVIAMNAKTLATQGRRHDFPEDRQRVFKNIAAEIGYSASLYADGKLIAGDVLTIIDDKAWFNIGGYDMEYGEYSPGIQLHARIIESCLEIGVREVNFLWGNSRWKSDVKSTRYPLTTLYLAQNKKQFMSMDFLKLIKPSLKQTLRLKAVVIFQKLGLKK